MTDWDLLTPGIGLTSIGIVGVGISLSGLAKTFLDGMNAVTLLTMYIGLIFLASGLFKDGFPTSGRAKSATFITLGFLVTFGVAAAVTVSVQVPSIYAYIGLMAIIAVPASVLTVASFRQSPYLKALAIIFISAAVVGGLTFYFFGLAAPKIASPATNQTQTNPTTSNQASKPPAVVVEILPGASAENNPAYKPAQFTIAKDVVTWTNHDNTPHTVTSSSDNGAAFDSKPISPNKNFTLDTSKLSAGVYDYFCTLHPHMKGSFTVTSPAASGSKSSNSSASSASNATGSSNQSSAQNPASASQSGGTVTSVTIVTGASVPTNGKSFVPARVNTTVGSMVRWTNDDMATHTVTSGDSKSAKPDGVFDSKFLNKGQSFSFVFDKSGEFSYFCTLHPFMQGQVSVK